MKIGEWTNHSVLGGLANLCLMKGRGMARIFFKHSRGGRTQLNGGTFFAIVTLLGGCGGNVGSPVPHSSVAPPVPSSPILIPDLGSKVQHIVIIVQENRSFDSFFSGYPDTRVNTASFGLTHNRTAVPLVSIGLEDGMDLDHSLSGFNAEYDGGRMDGFDQTTFFGTVHGGKPAALYPYSHIRQDEVQPYWDLAAKYTLADNMFPTQSSGSYTSHQDLIAGGAYLSPSESLIDFPSNVPWGCDAPPGTTTPTIGTSYAYNPLGPAPCVNYPTMATTLDAANVSWKYYAPYVHAPSGTTQDLGGFIWTAFDSIRSVRYGPDWARNISSPETNIFSDIASGSLPGVSWVIPDFKNSDHPQAASNTGPSWVTSIVNSIGQSQYGKNTAIIIVWDEWGGWYDHVRPPQLDYTGLGMRVPMIVVGAYARPHYVSHTLYEFGSILRFVEEVFNLPALGTTDTRANSIYDCFDFAQTPITFTTTRATFSRATLLEKKPSLHVVDDE